LDLLKLIGYAAALLTTISFLPQLVRTIRTRSACDLSFGMLALFLAGISLWLIYGLLSRQMPIILANGVTMLFNATLLVCKIVYK
jgi:MtN3 and saliva related transmembrane protein